MNFSPQFLPDAYARKRVLVTGHTGFKGSWLCEWLLNLGAEVAGYALEPETTPALFTQLGLAKRMHHQTGDVRDEKKVRAAVLDFQPDCVFHLAAQPLVRRSYAEPLETYAVNVMGTAHILDALRSLEKPCAAVMITTDKVYENLEAGSAFREDDKLGGHDPYSASKAAAEIVIESWRKSFFSAPGGRVALASARAGNVIGGGDWATDRIVPDCMRALQRGAPVRRRSTEIVRFITARTKLPVIAVGGIEDAATAREKLDAGAALIQLYTGFIYRGSSLQREIRRALRD
jgi:CDP-glucose 4,6-dehydratase